MAWEHRSKQRMTWLEQVTIPRKEERIFEKQSARTECVGSLLPGMRQVTILRQVKQDPHMSVVRRTNLAFLREPSSPFHQTRGRLIRPARHLWNIIFLLVMYDHYEMNGIELSWLRQVFLVYMTVTSAPVSVPLKIWIICNASM